MGNLLKDTPYSEVTATLEALASHGVRKEHLDLIRKDAGHAKAIANVMIRGLEYTTAKLVSTFQRDFTKEGFTLLEDVEPRISSVSGLKLLSFLKRGESYVNGEVMKKRAEEQKANFGQKDAEWLLAHQSEIPKEFRKYYLAFLGTVWQSSDDDRCVACLGWYGGRWDLDLGWLGSDWYSGSRLLCLSK